MQEWRVYGAIGAEPTIFEDQMLFWRYVNTLGPTAGVVVEHYEKVLRSRQTYGQMPNASSPPPDPKAVPISETVRINHVRPVRP